MSLPSASSDRLATVIFEDDEPVAAVIHDAALNEQRSFVETVGAYALVWDDNRRLAARVESPWPSCASHGPGYSRRLMRSAVASSATFTTEVSSAWSRCESGSSWLRR